MFRDLLQWSRGLVKQRVWHRGRLASNWGSSSLMKFLQSTHWSSALWAHHLDFPYTYPEMKDQCPNQTHRGLMYKPEASLLSNNEADPLLELSCSFASHACLECSSPDTRETILRIWKRPVTVHWLNNCRKMALKKLPTPPKHPSSLNGPGWPLCVSVLLPFQAVPGVLILSGSFWSL